MHLCPESSIATGGAKHGTLLDSGPVIPGIPGASCRTTMSLACGDYPAILPALPGKREEAGRSVLTKMAGFNRAVFPAYFPAHRAIILSQSHMHRHVHRYHDHDHDHDQGLARPPPQGPGGRSTPMLCPISTMGPCYLPPLRMLCSSAPANYCTRLVININIRNGRIRIES